MKGHDGLDWTDEGFGASDTALLSRMKDERIYAYFFSDAAEFAVLRPRAFTTNRDAHLFRVVAAHDIEMVISESG